MIFSIENSKLETGNHVKISKYKNTISKDYTTNW